MEPQNTSHRFIVSSAMPLLILMIILVVAGSLVYQFFSPGKNKEEAARVAPQVSESLKGKMRLTVVPSGGAGNTVRLSVNADSNGETITGFDVVIRYNHNNLTLRETEGRLPGYRLIDTDKQIEADKSELIITGLLDIDNEKPMIFKDTEIFQIVFTQTTSSKLADSVELIFTPQTITDSNLINASTQDILGAVEVSL